LIFHANVFTAQACFEHSNFLKVKVPDCEPGPVKGRNVLWKDGRPRPTLTACAAGQLRRARNPTTSFLTATTLIYATGAGITAAAGTRLALQWILVKVFKLHSFQLPDFNKPGIVISCHYLPVSGLGNLRACCLPWMWSPFLRRPLRNRTLILRYPLTPR
jgi:hypothetical protein